MDKDTKKFLAQAEAAGFIVTRLKSGHYRITTKKGQYVTVVSGTSSDVRGLRNAKSALKRFS